MLMRCRQAVSTSAPDCDRVNGKSLLTGDGSDKVFAVIGNLMARLAMDSGEN